VFYNPNFDATVLGYKTQNNALTQIVIQALSDTQIRGVAPGPDTSKPHPENKIYPYLLRGLLIDKVNQVWSTDITYIPMTKGFMYLVAVIDWHSRYILSWELSNTMDTTFCIDALEKALDVSTPEIFNTDQGAQFTSLSFTKVLLDKDEAYWYQAQVQPRVCP
jgi:putative transposase